MFNVLDLGFCKYKKVNMGYVLYLYFNMNEHMTNELAIKGLICLLLSIETN